MSSKQSAEVRSIACWADAAPSIDADRFARALSPALSEVISEGAPRTEFAARVVGFAREHWCPEGSDRLCDGPLGPRLPCPSCIDGLRSESIDEYDVWNTVVSEDRQ
jgi:hypothetical protein